MRSESLEHTLVRVRVRLRLRVRVRVGVRVRVRVRVTLRVAEAHLGEAIARVERHKLRYEQRGLHLEVGGDAGQRLHLVRVRVSARVRVRVRVSARVRVRGRGRGRVRTPGSACTVRYQAPSRRLSRSVPTPTGICTSVVLL